MDTQKVTTVISDIHSNLEAFKAVLDDIERQNPPVDEILCLGDIVGYGPNPNECCDLMKKLSTKYDVKAIRGNHEQAILYPDDEYFGFRNGKMGYNAAKAAESNKEMLTEENLKYLGSLPITREEHGIHMVHGIPGNPNEDEKERRKDQIGTYIKDYLENSLRKKLDLTWEKGILPEELKDLAKFSERLKDREKEHKELISKQGSEKAIEESYKELVEKIESESLEGVALGHYHVPILYVLKGGETSISTFSLYRRKDIQPGRDRKKGDPVNFLGNKFVLNPGSVGQPRDEDPRASYAIIRRKKIREANGSLYKAAKEEPLSFFFNFLRSKLRKKQGIEITLHRVDYKIDEVMDEIDRVNLEGYEIPRENGARLYEGK